MPWYLCLYITLQYTKLVHTHLIFSVALEDAPILQMRKSRLQRVGRLSQSRSCSKRQVGHWGDCLVCPLPEPLWWLIFIVNLTGSRLTQKHTSRCLWTSLQKCLPSRKDNSEWAAPLHWWIGVPGWIQSSSRLSTGICLSASWLDALHVCSYQHGFLLRWT